MKWIANKFLEEEPECKGIVEDGMMRYGLFHFYISIFIRRICSFSEDSFERAAPVFQWIELSTYSYFYTSHLGELMAEVQMYAFAAAKSLKLSILIAFITLYSALYVERALHYRSLMGRGLDQEN